MFVHEFVRRASDHGPSELQRLDYLDGWRGMGILLVLLSHFFQIREVDLGRMGVDVFFVLSGMLMANILFVKRVPLPMFYKRRVSRILPGFFIFLTVVSMASMMLDLSREHYNYFYSLFFVRTYWPENPNLWDTGIPIGHLWSLNVEEHCYVILSLIAVCPVMARRGWFAILTLGVGAILLQYLYLKYPSIASVNYHLKTEVAASCLLISAGYFLIKHALESCIPSWLPLFTLVLAFVCYSRYSLHGSSKWVLAPFLLAFTVNHINLSPLMFKSILGFHPLRLLGIWSFSIYLWQQPFYYYGTKGGWSFPCAGPALMLLSIGAGVLSFYWIENPARRYLNSRW